MVPIQGFTVSWYYTLYLMDVTIIYYNNLLCFIIFIFENILLYDLYYFIRNDELL